MADNAADQMSSMAMYFTASSNTTILFEFWTTTSPIGLFLSCLIIFASVLLYEIISKLLIPPSGHLLGTQGTSITGGATSKGYGTLDSDSSVEGATRWSVVVRKSLIDGGFHVIRQSIGYVIMLIVMTFNVWVCLAVVLGSGVGQVIVSLVTSRRQVRTKVAEEEPR